jgi:hypothetical protein
LTRSRCRSPDSELAWALEARHHQIGFRETLTLERLALDRQPSLRCWRSGRHDGDLTLDLLLAVEISR